MAHHVVNGIGLLVLDDVFMRFSFRRYSSKSKTEHKSEKHEDDFFIYLAYFIAALFTLVFSYKI